MVDPRFAGIVECCPLVDERILAKPGLNPKTWPKVEGDFDAAIDAQGLFKSGIVVAKARAKRKLGYHWRREGAWLFSQRVVPDPSSLHVVDQYVDIARAAGGIADRAEFALQPDPEAATSVQAKLGELATARYVVMNPGAGWATKRWPPGSFAELIQELEKEGLRSVLVGGKADADRAAVQEVLDFRKGDPLNLVGQTSVKELVALIAGAAAHVGGDTGSTHIAAALGRPAVGLYSITRPERSCPYGQIDRCHYHPDGLGLIRPEDVLRTALKSIQSG